MSNPCEARFLPALKQVRIAWRYTESLWVVGTHKNKCKVIPNKYKDFVYRFCIKKRQQESCPGCDWSSATASCVVG